MANRQIEIENKEMFFSGGIASHLINAVCKIKLRRL
jgi:hypothetical protein